MTHSDWQPDRPTILEQRRDDLGKEPWDSLRLVAMVEDSVSTFPLKPGVVVIGRTKEADLRIDSPHVSRRHARLFVADKLQVEDCGSQNGTFVR